MPLFNRWTTEDAPETGGPGPEPRTEMPQRTQTLTLELLDWLIAALEAVLATPQLQDLAEKRVRQSLRTALLNADHLYPLTLEAHLQVTADDTDEAVA